jgi:hypothetical protein
MNSTHKYNLNSKYLIKLKWQLKLLERQIENYGDDCPARLILVESRLKERIFALESENKGIKV